MVRKDWLKHLALGWGVLLLMAVGMAVLWQSTRPAPVAPPKQRRTIESTPTSEALAVPSAWQAPMMLVELYSYPNLHWTPEARWPSRPWFVLYADGRLLITPNRFSYDRTPRTILEAWLSPNEVCSVLHQIEVDGFFDLDLEAYRATYGEFANRFDGNTRFTVNSWRDKRSLLVFGVHGEWTPGSTPTPKPPDAEPDYILTDPAPAELQIPYRRLRAYEARDARPYQPEQLALLITPIFYAGGSAAIWPFSVPLETLHNQGLKSREGHIALVDGELAMAIYEELGQETAFWKAYREGEIIYNVSIRPLLPYEQFHPDQVWNRPSYDDAQSMTLDCSDVSVAAMPLPTPTPTPSPTSSPTLIPEASEPLLWVGELGKRDELGQFDSTTWPIYHLAITSDNEIVVDDRSNQRLQFFSLDGTFLRALYLPEEQWPSRALAAGLNGTLLVITSEKKVLVLAPDGTLLQTLDTPPAYHVAQGPDGRFYLSVGKSILILSATGELLESWQGPPERPFLGGPSALSVGMQGSLYVALEDEQRIVHRHPSGEVSEIPGVEARAIAALADGSLYVLERDVVRHYRGNDQEPGQRIGNLPEYSSNTLAVDADGTFVVLLRSRGFWQDMAILRYRPNESEPLAAFGTVKVLPGQFDAHLDFGVAPAGDVWLIDTDGWHSDEEPLPQLIHLEANDHPLQAFDSLGGLPFSCNSYRVAASSHMVAISNPCEGRVLLLSEQNEQLAEWGESGQGAGQFNLLTDIAFAADEQSLYVVDAGNRRLSRWALDGTLLAEWEASALGLTRPVVLDLAADGTVYLLDEEELKIVSLASDGSLRTIPLPAGVNIYAVMESYGSLGVSPDGTLFYLGRYGSGQGVLSVVNQEGALVGQHYAGGNGRVLIEVSASGRIYTSIGKERIYLYDPKPESAP